MKKIERNKKEKQARILKAARKTFQSSGFTSASMDTIAREAGVTKQTVYRYFNSKEALFTAALEAQRIKAKGDLLTFLQGEDTREALKKFAVEFITRHLSPEHLATVRLLVSEGPEVPEITRAFYAVGPGRTREGLAGFLRERFSLDDVSFEVLVFINTLIAMRMPLLTGLSPSPSPEEIRVHAEKSVDALITLLGQRGTGS